MKWLYNNINFKGVWQTDRFLNSYYADENIFIPYGVLSPDIWTKSIKCFHNIDMLLFMPIKFLPFFFFFSFFLDIHVLRFRWNFNRGWIVIRLPSPPDYGMVCSDIEICLADLLICSHVAGKNSPRAKHLPFFSVSFEQINPSARHVLLHNITAPSLGGKSYALRDNKRFWTFELPLAVAFVDWPKFGGRRGICHPYIYNHVHAREVLDSGHC